MNYQEYLSTVHWADLREAVLKRDGFRCTRCPCKERLQAHHKVYRATWYDSIPEDLVTLCWRCHKKEHGLPVPKLKQSKKGMKRLMKEMRRRACRGPRRSRRYRAWVKSITPKRGWVDGVFQGG